MRKFEVMRKSENQERILTLKMFKVKLKVFIAKRGI